MEVIKSIKFKPAELFEPSILDVLSPNTAMKMIGKFIINNLDQLRIDYEEFVHHLGKYKEPKDVWFTMNGVYMGELYRYSGVRSKDCVIGAEFSTHKKGTTFDVKAEHLGLLLALVKTHYKRYHIKRIEDPTVTIPRGWMHIEFSEDEIPSLQIFKP